MFTEQEIIKNAHVIVLGNEKGGSGKSTTAMHIAIALLKSGQRVGTIDVDHRQQTLTRYLRNRLDWNERNNAAVEIPEHYAVVRSGQDSTSVNEEREFTAFADAVGRLERVCDIIIIDTPGTDSYLSRLAHSMADTLVTPVNDSFIDLDVLAAFEPGTRTVTGPNQYGAMVEEARQRRHRADGGTIDWVVLRNRLAPLEARNKRRVRDALQDIGQRLDFRIVDGLGERVIFRELFLLGLTAFDQLHDGGKAAPSISHVAARQEIRRLMVEINLPEPVAAPRRRLAIAPTREAVAKAS
ncbi:MAG: division plane positioning ATPase MipZ [Alphaproteobacteria bacterium]